MEVDSNKGDQSVYVYGYVDDTGLSSVLLQSIHSGALCINTRKAVSH